MSAVRYMKQSLDFLHRSFKGAGTGLTPEQIHFVPEGESHSIAWVVWHAARIEDLLVQQVIRGDKQIWESDDWPARTGLPVQGFGTGQSTEDARAVRITDLDAFAAYAARVNQGTMELLDRLTDADLERQIQVGRNTETVGQCITLHLVTHLNGHRGEVNLIRGMMGFPPVLPNQGG